MRRMTGVVGGLGCLADAGEHAAGRATNSSTGITPVSPQAERGHPAWQRLCRCAAQVRGGSSADREGGALYLVLIKAPAAPAER